MTMASRFRLFNCVLAVLATLLACTGDNQGPGTHGRLAVEFSLAANATAPLDAMSITISGNNTTRTVDLTQSGGFWEGSADNLPVGSYTLTAIGEGGGDVTYYGKATGVQVRADETTDASVPIVEFIPTITSISPPSPTKSMTFTVNLSAVTGATTYRVDWTLGSVGGFVSGQSNSLDVPVTALGNIEFSARVGNNDVDVTDAATSSPMGATSEADAEGKDPSTARNLGSGAGTHVIVSDVNIGTPDEEDWYEVNIVAGEVLIVNVWSSSLDPASALDPYLTVYDFNGNIVWQNDDGVAGQPESFLLTSPVAQTGQYYLVVSSSGRASTGHYEMEVIVTTNDPVGKVVVSPSSSTIQPSGTVQLNVRLEDINGFEVFYRTVTWTSSNTGVATVDANGLVHGVADGVATITAESEGVTGTARISVGNAVSVVNNVALGVDFTCASMTTGEVYCWGRNGFGQLGNGTTSTNPSPTPGLVSGGQSFLFVQADGGGGSSGVGYFGCGLTAQVNGNAYCWGENNLGQLGNGTSGSGNQSLQPTPVNGGLDFLLLDTGSRHACALVSSGQMYCWGDDGNGTGGTGSRPVPTAITDGNLYKRVSAGVDHTCALLAVDGSAWCFGGGSYGELGDGQKTSHQTPTLVDPGLLLDQIRAGDRHTCAIDTKGDALCWGWNDDGQLGNGGSAPDQCLGTLACEGSPVAVSGGQQWKEISAGHRFTCGINSSDQAYCWGQNTSGKLGTGSVGGQQLTPVLVNTTERFKAIVAGRETACGISTSDELWCWGDNTYGQLGDGTTTGSAVPVKVVAPVQ
jgi:alpha-tubulin suppressor-like RCC1 family protein